MIDDPSFSDHDLLSEGKAGKSRKNSSETKSRRSQGPKVKDLILLLQDCIDIVSNPLFGGKTDKTLYLEKVKNALLKQKNLSLNDFIYKLEQLPSIKETRETSTVNDLTLEEIQKLSPNDIRALCENYAEVSKATLDRIGHERFGISMSQLKSGSKEKSIRLILSSLENLDILNSIAEKAKSSSTDYN
ncbi:hypothetical protein M0651_13975 [Paenibacillus sp. MBLB2552]|uniref:Uncharacterized protein n=1 Tax=Paenibacillus mellifer TaxID=2937794 RepID=A0A9X2BQW2_9BACL|nr:hypothetical protein [Paenibacillus mellifer]MCK8488282.1 hypothetical protein [Paenibacillus mellifer]